MTQLGGIFDPKRPLYETLENMVFANEKFSFLYFINSSLFPTGNWCPTTSWGPTGDPGTGWVPPGFRDGDAKTCT